MFVQKTGYSLSPQLIGNIYLCKIFIYVLYKQESA